MSDVCYDIIIIGGGPAGYKCAITAARLGLKVGCVDSNPVLGGTCLNRGCIPSKALLHYSHEYYNIVNNVSKFGIKVDNPSFDLNKMMDFKNAKVNELGQGIDSLFNSYKVTKITGIGRISSFEKGNLSVSVEGKNIKARHIIIASGSDVATLPGIEVDEQDVVSSTGALSFPTVPGRLAVIGAGAIGLEMSSVWSRLGSKVTVVEFFDKIAGSTDNEVSRNLLSVLKKQGIDFKLSSKVKEIKKEAGALQIVIESASDNTLSTIEVDKVLVAVGRRPVTQNLGIENIIEQDSRGFIKVNEKYETNVSGVYAIGDVIGRAMLAHKAEEEGIAVAEIIAGQLPSVEYDIIPSVIYTHPAVSSIGKIEEELKKENVQYKAGKSTFAANGRSRVEGDTEGFVKILASKDKDEILGVHIIGAYADVLINEAAVAMAYGAATEDIYRICHSHPDVNETFRDAAINAFFKNI
ncbi:dihydrolipoyl dehydrogenase [Candidatus Mesenet endosymbiont of Phosphuga atrata]|uniref:dihydrolipoyl dehydrogenase n=1 Tax=Candidatus Mesenet endosymbiont of Phosphuga atrata TaxID=3066221 RepID=UPI0030D4AB0E